MGNIFFDISNANFTIVAPLLAAAAASLTGGRRGQPGAARPAKSRAWRPRRQNTGVNVLAGATGDPLQLHRGSLGPTYTIVDGAASYGTIGVGASASCTATGNCVALRISASSRPAAHWDASVLETFCAQRKHEDLGAARGRQLHRRPHVEPVLPLRGDDPAQERDRRLHGDHVLPGQPHDPRADGGLRARARGSRLATPRPLRPRRTCSPTFPRPAPSAAGSKSWPTARCRRRAAGPASTVRPAPATREQMAVFVLRTLDPALNPPACAPPNLFADVPETSPFCRWIEELANRGVVTGCGGGNYCPTAAVTREQMSVFLHRDLRARAVRAVAGGRPVDPFRPGVRGRGGPRCGVRGRARLRRSRRGRPPGWPVASGRGHRRQRRPGAG